MRMSCKFKYLFSKGLDAYKDYSDHDLSTHNGLMHVLDAVMLPLGQINSTTPSGRPTPTATGTGSSSSASVPASTGAATSLTMTSEGKWTLWALVTSLLLIV